MCSGRYWQAQGKGKRFSMREGCHQDISTEQKITPSTCINSHWTKKVATSSPKNCRFLLSYPLPPCFPGSSTSLLAHVQQIVWVSPGTVHTAPHHCVLPPPPTVAPQGADSVHTVPSHGRSRWPRPLYHGSQEQVMLPWKSCRCFGIRRKKEDR